MKSLFARGNFFYKWRGADQRLLAISASNGAPAVTDSSTAQAWLSESAEAKMRDTRSAAPRTRLATKEYQTGTVFEIFDEAVDDRVILRTNIISH